MLHHHLGDFLLFFSFFPSIVAAQIQEHELCGWLVLCYVMLNYVMKCHVMDLHLGGFKDFLVERMRIFISTWWHCRC